MASCAGHGVKARAPGVDRKRDTVDGFGKGHDLLLLVAAALCVATVPLFGGRLSALAELRLRRVWSLVAALGLQVVALVVVPGLPGPLPAAAHLLSYVCAGVFVASNRRIPGLWAIALGGASNFAAISANHGVMPAAASAVRSAGLASVPGQFANSRVLAGARLRFLGDVFAIPYPLPLHNVFSVGDVVIALGAFLLLHGVCESRLRRALHPSRRSRATTGAS